MDNSKKTKPLILAIDEAEKLLVNTVNKLLIDEGIPCYYLEFIVDKIHRQLKTGATAELNNARKSVEPREEVEKNGS